MAQNPILVLLPEEVAALDIALTDILGMHTATPLAGARPLTPQEIMILQKLHIEIGQLAINAIAEE